METINERVRLIREALGMTQLEFSHRLRHSTSNAISMIERGKTSLTDYNIQSICTPNLLQEGHTVSRIWLLNGGDPSLMFEEPDGPSDTVIYDKNQKKLSREACELVWIYQQLNLQNKRLARKQIDVLLECQDEQHPRIETEGHEVHEPEPPYTFTVTETGKHADDETANVIFLPRGVTEVKMLGTIAAGSPIEFDTDPDPPTRLWATDLIKGNPDNYYCVLVRGDSMTEANIQDGDYVLLERAEYPQHGRTMLIRYNDSSTLKRIKISEGRDGEKEVWMCWEDGSGKSERLQEDGYEIQGRLVAIERKSR